MDTDTKWLPDKTLDGLDASFGADDRTVARLMPAYSDIPDEFKVWGSSNKWVQFQSDWFFKGFKQFDVVCREGIDRHEAVRHLAAINRSMVPKHEHKAAAVAYLASLWFEHIEYTTAK